jgi:hypothetical protein
LLVRSRRAPVSTRWGERARRGARAKAANAQLVEAAGYATIDLGGLVAGGHMQRFPGGVFPSLNLPQLEQAA